MQPERRSYPRYRTKHDDILVLSRKTNIIGFGRDICSGGLRLDYCSPESERENWERIDIMSKRHVGWLLPDLYCRAVYDLKGILESSYFKGHDVRQCGLCFEMLTPSQEMKLQQLLEMFRFREEICS